MHVRTFVGLSKNVLIDLVETLRTSLNTVFILLYVLFCSLSFFFVLRILGSCVNVVSVVWIIDVGDAGVSPLE